MTSQDDYRKKWLAAIATWPDDQRRALLKWVSTSTPPEPHQTPRPHNESSILTYVRGYNTARMALCAKGAICSDAAFDAPAHPENLRVIIDLLARGGRKPTTARTILIGIERVMCGACPEFDRHHLNVLIKATPRRSDPRDWHSRVRDVGELTALAWQLIAAADDPGLDPIERAIRYRNGLIILFLAYRPYRKTVFTSFDYIDDAKMAARHTGNSIRDINGTWTVVCRRHQPNRRIGGRDYSCRARFKGGKYAPEILNVPIEVAAALQLWVTVHRRVLIANNPSCPALLVSERGDRLSAMMIYKIVSKVTKETFGKSLCPQLFRTSYAASERRRAKGHKSEAYRVLGHKEHMTHERYLPPDLRLTAEAGHTISRAMDDLLGAEAFTLPRDDHGGPSDT